MKFIICISTQFCVFLISVLTNCYEFECFSVSQKKHELSDLSIL
jgi:hypothetical protein